jgi:hypothetical protein
MVGVGIPIALPPDVTVAKAAVTDRAWLMVRLHDVVPVQSPPQPANVELALAVAVKFTDAPES